MQQRRSPGLWVSSVVVIAVVSAIAFGAFSGGAPWASGQSAKRIIVPGVARDTSGGAPSPTPTVPASPSATATSTASSTPSATATPTNTATPTASPSPTVTQQPGSCSTVCARRATMYTDESGTWVVGEIVNLRPSTIEFVVLEVELLNGSGSVIDVVEAYPDVVVFPEGGDSPFYAYFPATAGAASFRITVVSYDEPATEAPVTGVNISLNAGFIDEFGGYVISGTATNTSGTAYLDVSVSIALYNGAGDVIRADYVYLDTPELGPGGSESFEIVFDPPPAGVAGVRSWVEGYRGD